MMAGQHDSPLNRGEAEQRAQLEGGDPTPLVAKSYIA